MFSQARYDEAVRGLTGIARRVFGYVPKQEAWTFAQLATEMTRGGVSVAPNIMQGCVNSLVQIGLVIEGPKGHFVQASARVKTVNPEFKEVAVSHIQLPIAKNITINAKPSNMDRLSNMSESIRKLGNTCLTVADQLDDFALELEGQRTEETKELEGLRELRRVLKGLA